MGQHYHVRVCINGYFAYNRGGDESKWLKERCVKPGYNPMDDNLGKCIYHTRPTGSYRYTVIDQVEYLNDDDIHDVTYIFVRRSPHQPRLRTVEMIVKYGIRGGIIIWREIYRPKKEDRKTYMKHESAYGTELNQWKGILENPPKLLTE